MLRRTLDRVVLGVVRLHDHLPGQLAASGAAGNLREQLEDALGSAKIRQPQRVIAAHHAHQRHAVHIVALGDHLRAHQQVDLARVQAHQQPLHVAAAANGVAIHAPDARAGENLLQTLLALLRSRAQKIQIFAVAVGAAPWHRLFVTAVVTF